MSWSRYINNTIKKIVSKLNLYAFEYIGRYGWLRSTYRNMLASFGTVKPLSSKQKKELKRAWGKYSGSKSFLIFNQYINDGDRISDYIPVEYFLFKMEPTLNKTFESKYLDDKNLYDLYFPDIKQPKTVARFVSGMYLDKDYHIITKAEAYNLAKAEGRVIIKEAKLSMGGHGIRIWENVDGELDFYKMMESSQNVIAQEFIRQHKVLGELNDSSINTLRIASLLVDGEVHIVTKFIRVGSPGKLVDNVSSGGMYCGIKDNGSLEEVGYNFLGQPRTSHPSGVEFKNVSIPNFDKCIDYVKELTPRMAYVSKLQSWDLAIGEDGTPVLIEPNYEYPDILVNQIACGPYLSLVVMRDFCNEQRQN